MMIESEVATMASDSKNYIIKVRIIRQDLHKRLTGQLIYSPVQDNSSHRVTVNYRRFMPKGYHLANGTTANYKIRIGKRGPELKGVRFKYVQDADDKSHKQTKQPKPSSQSTTGMIRKNQKNLDRAETYLNRYNDNLKKILSNRSSNK